MCGEKMMKAGSNCAMLGSPPRMRGKASGKSWDQRRAGITPAYAGKRRTIPRRITPAYAGKRLYEPLGCITKRDHPRVCGEKSMR